MITFEQIENLAKELNYAEEKMYYDKIYNLMNSGKIDIRIASLVRAGRDGQYGFNSISLFNEQYNKNIDYEKIFCMPYYGNDISIIDQLKNKFPEPDFRIYYGADYCETEYRISIRWGQHDNCHCAIL